MIVLATTGVELAILAPTSSIDFISGIRGEAEAIPMRTDVQAWASGAEGIAAVAGAGSEWPGVATALNRFAMPLMGAVHRNRNEHS